MASGSTNRRGRDDDDEQEDRKGKKGKGSGAVQFGSKHAIDVGLFTSGEATIEECVFAEFKYPNSTVKQPMLIVVFKRGDETYEQAYSIGKGWKIAKGGELVPTGGNTGLARSCNAQRHFVNTLEKAIEASGGDVDEVMAEFPSSAEGLEVIVRRVPQEKRDGLDRSNRKRGDDPGTILEIEEITDAPWMGKSSGKKKAKARDEDEEDEETPRRGKKTSNKADDEDDDDEDEAPRHRNRASKDDEDDEDEEAEAKPKAKGKSKPKDDDEDESDDDEELLEEGIEALMSALEKTEKPIKLAVLDDALAAVLKKHPKKDAIIALMTSKATLKQEKGWNFDGKAVELP